MSHIQLNRVPPYFHYDDLGVDKDQILGSGLYGKVCKAVCDQLPCAAKLLESHPERNTIVQDLSKKRELLNSIRHPYIVQFLDITLDPESKVPVLLTELLDESLTKMLESSQQPLSYHLQVDICHDIAVAVAYLHSQQIIHRDLCSNNVLMIARKQAKVADFGMFGLTLANNTAVPIMASLNLQPEAQVYLTPEALKEPPRYTKKLDCYSEGVIMVQLVTHQAPMIAVQMEYIKHSTKIHFY